MARAGVLHIYDDDDDGGSGVPSVDVATGRYVNIQGTAWPYKNYLYNKRWTIFISKETNRESKLWSSRGWGRVWVGVSLCGFLRAHSHSVTYWMA